MSPDLESGRTKPDSHPHRTPPPYHRGRDRVTVRGRTGKSVALGLNWGGASYMFPITDRTRSLEPEHSSAPAHYQCHLCPALWNQDVKGLHEDKVNGLGSTWQRGPAHQTGLDPEVSPSYLRPKHRIPLPGLLCLLHEKQPCKSLQLLFHKVPRNKIYCQNHTPLCEGA